MSSVAPVDLELSVYSTVRIRSDNEGGVFLILEIGHTVDLLRDARVEDEILLFVADDVLYSYKLPEEIYEILDIEILHLQIQNVIINEMFDEIEGPSVEVICE